MPDGQKRVFVQTMGCQMNEHDTERILARLVALGYTPTERQEEADLVFLNTCSVRDRSEQKVYSILGTFGELKRRNPSVVVGVGGCVAQQQGAALLARVPHLDLVVGTDAIDSLPSLLARVRPAEGPPERVASTRFRPTYPAEPDMQAYIDHLVPRSGEGMGRVRAFVTIMRGCDHFCSFCIVPYVRGRERSRPAWDIVREVEGLAARGIKEVTLLGQNVNSYGRKRGCGETFVGLLERLDRIEGLERVRFTTSHPVDLSDDLIEAYGRLRTLCEHLHLPVQSGSPRILEAMRREYTLDRYLDVVRRLKARVPGLALTTDVIVGFPGETEADFEATLALMEEVGFADAFVFKYSPRPRTAAARLPDQVPEPVKEARLARALALQARLADAFRARQVGRTVEVLVEGRAKRGDGLTGRTRTNLVVNFPGDPALVGRLVPVYVTEALPHSLRGLPVGQGGGGPACAGPATQAFVA
ncbi:MAG TPA: tRNA (N6-isopentenyl adenosine(37)-C2)-methylthiotransferase MiaB [Thermodesulfobacteriota bacterium]